MKRQFNKLTPAEHERLSILIEECAEVQQIACKILRHGYESHNPKDECKNSNRALLEQELGDLKFATSFMEYNSDVNPNVIDALAQGKALKIRKYLHHNDNTIVL